MGGEGDGHRGQGVDGRVGIEVGVDESLDHDAERAAPHCSRQGGRELGREAALGKHTAGDRFDLAAVLTEIVEDAGAHLGVVKTYPDQLDVQPVDVATAPQHRLEVFEGLQRGADGVVLVRQLHLGAAPGKHGEHQPLLRPEVVMDQALCHPGLFGDVLDRGALVALSAERPEGGLQDLFARLRRGGASAITD
jgi:hypothetical protein